MIVETVVIEEMVVIIEFKRCGRLDSITFKQVKSSIIIRKKKIIKNTYETSKQTNKRKKSFNKTNIPRSL